MRKYKNFIYEKNIIASKTNADNYLNRLDGFDIDNAIFYRSHDPQVENDMEITEGPDYIVLTPKERKSRSDRFNLLNIILSQYDYLPKRNKSITFTDLNTVYNFHSNSKSANNSKIYQVIPQNNIKIAIVPGKDLNIDIPYKFIDDFYYSPRDFTSELFGIILKISDFISNDLIVLYNITTDNFKEKCEEIDSIIRGYNIEDDGLFLRQTDIYRSFFEGFYKSDKKLYDYLLDIFDPLKAGFKIIDFKWEDMKDPNYRQQFIGRECWIDTKCLLIKKKF